MDASPTKARNSEIRRFPTGHGGESNAIKFTPQGGKVQVLLQRKDSHVEFSVSDTGIGIPASSLPHVFDRFSQKDSSTTRSYGWLGLGLAIAKQLVELHGGSLEAKSPGEGQGATFIVSLPLTILETEAGDRANRVHLTHLVSEEQALLPSLAGIAALVMDDEADTRDLMQRVCKNKGQLYPSPLPEQMRCAFWKLWSRIF
jgi:hypothetical protein